MELSPAATATAFGDVETLHRYLDRTPAVARDCMDGAVRFWESQGRHGLTAHHRRCLRILHDRGLNLAPWADRLRAIDPDAADALPELPWASPSADRTQALGTAVLQGDAPTVKRCLLEGGNPNGRLRRPGRSPIPMLASAVLQGRPDLISLLMDHGARPSHDVAEAVTCGFEAAHASEPLPVRLGRRLGLIHLQSRGQDFTAHQARLARVSPELILIFERVNEITPPRSSPSG